MLSVTMPVMHEVAYPVPVLFVLVRPPHIETTVRRAYQVEYVNPGATSNEVFKQLTAIKHSTKGVASQQRA
jgi:hypothetical protein